MTDVYKLSHKNMETPGTQLIYSNFTPRKSRTGFPGVIWFGLQAYLKKMKKSWDHNFFNRPRSVVQKYHNMFNRVCGHADSSHFEALHDLGYLPLEIRAAKEGEFVKCGVPTLVLWNTHPDFSWLTNFIETDLSNNLWFPSTSATTAFQYLINFTRGCRETCNEAMIPYLAHDFSYRGMTSLESAQLSGAAHLTCFDGTDTFPAIEFVEEYYDDQVGSSVPASEHSVASLNILYNQSLGMSQEDAEVAAIKRLITEVYPNGILSLVCDTFDYWRVITEILPQLKSEILARNGKLVVRPDCYDDKTQILTNEGWKYFEDLNENDLVAQVNDDGEQEFVKPQKIIKQKYIGDMVAFNDFHGRVDLLVTPNHRMIYEKDGALEEDLAENIKLYHEKKFIRSVPRKNVNKKISDIERLKIAFQADGSYISRGHGIRFSFSKQRKIDRLIDLVTSAGFSYSKYVLSDGKVEIHVKCDESMFSKDFYWVDLKDPCGNWCREFIEELSRWDSCIRSEKRIKFDTTNQDVSSIVELIATFAGYGVLTSVYKDNRKEHFKDVYTSNILIDNHTGTQNVEKHTVDYNGYVYCVKVPSGRIIVKRNRCILVSGNSGDPVKIICGDPSAKTEHERNGSIRCLWDIFGGTINDKACLELDSHIGLIYGDSITLARQEEILSKLRDKCFAANNVVLGVGSYTYQYVTRDTYGWAVKATAARVNGVDIPLYKDPKTDDGTKKSLKGFLHIKNGEVTDGHAEHEGYDCVFRDGEILRHQTFGEIRQLVKSQLEKFV